MADKKVTELSAITNLSGDDLLLVVNDPSGTPTSNKVTVTNLFANVVPNVVHKGTVTARGNTTFSGTTMTVSANATYSGTLTVSGTLVESGISTRSGVQVFNGNTIHNDSLKANGGIVLSSAVTSGGSNIIGSNGKINANNAISSGTITDEMLYVTPIGNTVARTLISDRMQVANVQSILANTNAYIASLETDIADRAQVANTLLLSTTTEQRVVSNVHFASSNSTTGVSISNGSITVRSDNTSPASVTLFCQAIDSSNTNIAKSVQITTPSNGLLANNVLLILPSSNGTVALTTDTPQIHLTFSVANEGSVAYTFSGGGASGANNETLYLYKGFTYEFINTAGASHPFQILNTAGGSAFANGVTGSQSGTQLFTVPHAQQSNLVYQCSIHSGMQGTLVIVS